MTNDVHREVIATREREGVAGQYAVIATVRYEWPNRAPETHYATFMASRYGGPVIIPTGHDMQTVIDREVVDRCGDPAQIDQAWIERFYGVQS